MTARHRAPPLLLCLLLCGSGAACTVVTQIGGDCANLQCPARSSCAEAKQQLPTNCDEQTRTCNGVTIPDDKQACEECGMSNERIGVKNTAMAMCTCAHCAAQLVGCFESAERETDGDLDRDTRCRLAVECGWANQCSGSECFCGKDVDRVTCLEQANSGHPMGPCADVIIQAAKCGGPGSEGNVGNCVLAAQLQTDTALFRASAVAQCATGDPLLSSAEIEPQCSRDLYLLK